MHWQDLLLFPLVGAAIGAATNRIALRMLFRPYNPLHIGRFRVPFTPGVIPANRELIAARIAHTFEHNLLSGDDLHQLITGARMQAIIERRVDDLFARLGPMARLVSGMKPQVVVRILEALEEAGRTALEQGGEFDVAAKIEQRINDLDVARLEALILEVSDRQLRHITWFGGLIGALVGLLQVLITSLF